MPASLFLSIFQLPREINEFLQAFEPASVFNPLNNVLALGTQFNFS